MKTFISRRLPVAVGTLLVFCVAGSAAAQAPPTKLRTKWAAEVTPTRALPEYPRPEMARPGWQNLNGLWDYAIVEASAAKPETFAGKILVPFAVQSQLSGVATPVTDQQRLWYRRAFRAPAAGRLRALLLPSRSRGHLGGAARARSRPATRASRRRGPTAARTRRTSGAGAAVAGPSPGHRRVAGHPTAGGRRQERAAPAAASREGAGRAASNPRAATPGVRGRGAAGRTPPERASGHRARRFTRAPRAGHLRRPRRAAARAHTVRTRWA